MKFKETINFNMIFGCAKMVPFAQNGTTEVVEKTVAETSVKFENINENLLSKYLASNLTKEDIQRHSAHS